MAAEIIPTLPGNPYGLGRQINHDERSLAYAFGVTEDARAAVVAVEWQRRVPVFDQGMIDLYGLRSEPPVQAHEFTNPTSAAVSAQLMLQRKLYVRNTVTFRLGWAYALLEPMDIVLVTDIALGLAAAPYRITRLDEDDNGELSVTAEEIPSVTP